MPGKKGKGGGGVGRGKSLYTLLDGKDANDIRREQWTEADFINAMLNMNETAHFLDNETYLRLRLYQISGSKCKAADILGCDEKVIRKSIDDAVEKLKEHAKNCVIAQKYISAQLPKDERIT